MSRLRWVIATAALRSPNAGRFNNNLTINHRALGWRELWRKQLYEDKTRTNLIVWVMSFFFFFSGFIFAVSVCMCVFVGLVKQMSPNCSVVTGVLSCWSNRD